MKILIYFSLFVSLKGITGQVIPYGLTAGATNHVANAPAVLTAGGPSSTKLMQQTSMPSSYGHTQISNQMPAGSYLSNANLANTIGSADLVNSKWVNTNLVNMGSSLAPAVTANVVTDTADPIHTVGNLANAAGAVLAVEKAAKQLSNAHENTLTAVENINYQPPVLNGNMATFYLGNNGNTFTVTSGSPGTQGLGVQVMADALEVGGTVAVNGRIPIYGMVGINGNIPTDGMASVSYSCANPSTLI